jgi:Na+/phosphate symporter
MDRKNPLMEEQKSGLDIEVLEFGEIPKNVKEILTNVEIKYGYLVFGDKAIKFPEPPIELAKRIVEKWNDILEKIHKEIVDEYKKALGKEELTQEDLEKLGIVLGRLPEVELRRHIGKYENDIKEIISYVIGQTLAEKYFPKMTMQQLFFNIYSILTLVLYSTPLHELLKNIQNVQNSGQSGQIETKTTEQEQKEGNSPFLT